MNAHNIPQLLANHFGQYMDVPMAVWEGFSKLGVLKTYKKNNILKRNNDIERYMHFLIEGTGGILMWHNNNFICTDLVFEGGALSDYISFSRQESSHLEVVAFEDCETFSVPREKFELVLQNGNPGVEITRIMAEQAFMEKQQQQIDLLTKTAAERYVDLMKNYKKNLNHVPDKYIASYLGITPQSFSRIKHAF